MIVTWKAIKGFEDKYLINQFGDVYNRETHKLLKESLDRCIGYMKVNLYYGKKNHIFLVHRLVAQAFVPNPDGLAQVHHKDGNKKNNCAENLEWVSRKTHVEKMSAEQKAKFRETFQNNIKKRKNLQM